VLSASNPLYLSGVQATATLNTDSLLTINAGIVKKTPYTSISNSYWNLTGNIGLNYATNFIGTTDKVSMRFRTNNIQRMIVDSVGNVGIGTAKPLNALSVLASSNPLYLSGVQATSTFNTDSVLTINAGIVKKTPYSSLTDNFWSLTGNSGTNYSTNFLGTTDNVSLRFRTNNTEQMILDSLGTLSIGSYGVATFNPDNPPKLSVDYNTTTSNTIAYMRGSIDSYFQMNIRNKSNGTSASTDYVATSDDGTDSTYYVDLGINSSTYATGVENWGGPHDAYLYSSSRNLLMGAASSNSDVIFLLGGGRTKYNTVLRLDGSTGNVIVGTGNNQSNATGNIIRGPNGGTGTNIPGGSLTLQGGSSNGNTSGGNLNLYGGGTVSGTMGSVNINTSVNSATNINTGTSPSNVTIGNSSNNILLPKFNTAGGMIYTDATTGQIASTGSNLTWDDANNSLGIGISNPSYKLSVLSSSDPLYLSGVQATTTFSSDSILTINGGVVKKTAYSSLPGSVAGWSLTGNAAASGNFLGTTNTTPLLFKYNNISSGIIDANNNTAFGKSYSFSGSQNTAIGYSANAANSSTAVGANADANAASNTAIGNSATANISSQATAIGASSQALYQYNTAVGYNAQATVSNQETVVGASAQAQGQNNIAIGYSAKANNSNQITVVGSNAQANFQNNTVVGYNAQAISNNQATAIGASSGASAQNATALGYNATASGINSTAIGSSATTSQNNALILGTSTTNVGIATSTPNTTAALDVNGKFKLGDVGTVNKNIVSFSSTLGSTSLAAGTGGLIFYIGTVTFTASSTDVIVTVPSATNYLTSTRATVTVSPAFDLPTGVSIASARMISTSQVRIRFVNATTDAQAISGNLYITITEF
jgi:hypothetical protein